MAFNLRCMICGNEHKARKDKFPVVYAIQDKDAKTGAVIEKILGHVCKKCVRKARKHGGRIQ